MPQPLRFAACSAVLFSLALTQQVEAQNAVLAEMYGRGVHAYSNRNYSEARQLLSLAIDNGIKDPRAYYFRGIVAYSSGSTFEAESDWQRGAEMEAQGNTNPLVGKSIIRFQGSGRLKLEAIRQRARLQALALRAARAAQGQSQLGQNQTGQSQIGQNLGGQATTPPPPTEIPQTPVPPPPPAGEDPFSNDLAEGEPAVTSEDALEGAMDDPFADVAGAPAADAGSADDPFGGDATADPSDDPFGDDGGAEADPFGGDEGDDPFGGDSGDDPFGGDSGDDPFADDSDPFGS